MMSSTSKTSTTPTRRRKSRIPLTLQAVFLASNRGHEVHQPPPGKVAAKVFLRHFGVGRRAATAKRKAKNNKKSSSSNNNKTNDLAEFDFDVTANASTTVAVDMTHSSLSLLEDCIQQQSPEDSQPFCYDFLRRNKKAEKEGSNDDRRQQQQQEAPRSIATTTTTTTQSRAARRRSIATTTTTTTKPSKAARRRSSFQRPMVGMDLDFPVCTLSPMDYLDALIRQRGYSTQRYETLQTAYHNHPTPLQLASYQTHLINLVTTSTTDKQPEKQLHTFKELLGCGVALNPCNPTGESLVHMICRRGSAALPFLHILLQLENKQQQQHFAAAAADNMTPSILQVCDDHGRTPLHDACWTVKSEPSFDVIELLLKKDRRMLHLTDCRSAVPLDYVAKKQWGAWLQFLESRKDVYWPHRRTSQQEEAPPPLTQLKANSRPSIDPPNALFPELATMVASGRLSVCEADYLRTDDFACTIHQHLETCTTGVESIFGDSFAASSFLFDTTSDDDDDDSFSSDDSTTSFIEDDDDLRDHNHNVECSTFIKKGDDGDNDDEYIGLDDEEEGDDDDDSILCLIEHEVHNLELVQRLYSKAQKLNNSDYNKSATAAATTNTTQSTTYDDMSLTKYFSLKSSTSPFENFQQKQQQQQPEKQQQQQLKGYYDHDKQHPPPKPLTVYSACHDYVVRSKVSQPVAAVTNTAPPSTIGDVSQQHDLSTPSSESRYFL